MKLIICLLSIGGHELKLIVGTRGSKLAVAQTKIVIDAIKSNFENIDVDIKIISTKGDRVLDKSLDKIGDKGIFTQEIERQLIDGEIDFAIHSLKDMPSELGEGLVLTKTIQREDPRDLLILNSKFKKIDDPIKWLKENDGMRIGTGSKRRSAQLLNINPNLKIDLIRGNIDTRLEKMEKESYDAIVLAAAGVNRLKMDWINSYVLDDNSMIPAVGQGALAIEIKEGNQELMNIFEAISDDIANVCVEAERTYLATINGGCHMPVGALAQVNEGKLCLKGIYGSEDCKLIVSSSLEGPLEDAQRIGRELADKILREFEEKKR